MSSTVIVGLSGGVDSSLAALLLKERGYHVIGVSMSIYNQDIPNLMPAGNSCYGPEEKQDIKDIQKFGDKIGIETHVFDCSEDYKRLVLSYFKEEYQHGRTPNPCVKCNAVMKFGLLGQKAKEAGISYDYFATGHYARIENENGRFLLKKGIEEKKDQSYFLYRLTQEQLTHTLFPLGTFTKAQTRALAQQKGLDVYDKPDSQDFYSGDYNDLLQFPPKQGVIMHINGQVLGKHMGYWHYTIGQRKGLGIAYPEPLFVLDIDAHRNIVYVGTAQDTQKKDVFVTDLAWIAFDGTPDKPFKAFAKQRSAAQPAPVMAYPVAHGLRVVYDEPQKSFTPGQSLVLYQNDVVLGGGIITKENATDS